MKALSDFLRPEFIGRVDEVVVFRALTESDYEKIAVLMLNELVGPLHEKGHSLHLGGGCAGDPCEKSLWWAERRA